MARRRKSIGKSIAQVAPVYAGRGFVSSTVNLIDPVMFAYMPSAPQTSSPTAFLNAQGRLAARIYGS